MPRFNADDLADRWPGISTAADPPAGGKRSPFGGPKALNNYGGARRDRTADLLNAIQALSQLSYGPSGIRCQWSVIRSQIFTV